MTPINTKSLAPVQEKTCPFHDEKSPIIDYKNVRMMRNFMSSYRRILPRRRTGLCAKHQRQVARELKRGRHVALVQFVRA